MKNTQLEVYANEQILNVLNSTKLVIEKLTNILGNLLISKITDNYKAIDSERLQDLFDKTIDKIKKELDSLFYYYQVSEIEFYSKNLKTADLIFNTLNDKRTQRIYLENLLKKIDQKEENLELIFTESAKNRLSSEVSVENIKNVESKENLSIDEIFNQFVQVVVNNRKLSIDESADLRKLIQHYYSLYKEDVSLAINNFLRDNKVMAIINIEDQMDNKEIRNGKTSAVTKIERSITNNSLKVMEQLLADIVSKYKKNALDELKICSSTFVEVIFRLLPVEYQDQRGLLEIIIDTNINERLGKLLEIEAKKITDILQAKNQDMIANELYDEKRYKKLDDYQFDLSLVEKVYQDVLHEIRISYDIQPDKASQNVLHEIRKSYNIPEPDEVHNKQSKRLNLVVLGESNSAKNIFIDLVDSIKLENKKNLEIVLADMNRLSQEAQKENNKQVGFSSKK